MKTAQRRYKGDYDRPVCSAPKAIEIGQYVYLDCPAMNTFSVERLATKSYIKLLSTKMGPLMVIKVSPTTVTIDEDGIENKVSVDRAAVAPTVRETPGRVGFRKEIIPV